jgi:hypothetical protein
MEFHLTEKSTRLWLVVIALGVLTALTGGAAIALASPIIPFGLIIAILAAAIVLSNIEFGIYALIAVAVLLPFGALPFNVGFNPTFLDFAMLAVFGLACAWAGAPAHQQTCPERSRGFVATLALPIVSFMGWLSFRLFPDSHFLLLPARFSASSSRSSLRLLFFS